MGCQALADPLRQLLFRARTLPALLQETNMRLFFCQLLLQALLSLLSRLRCIYLPALEPHCLSGCRSALGLCWKAGVAAEVIGVCSGSVGGMLYDAKIYLEISDLFAWTLVIVLLSVGFEWVFLRLLKWIMKKGEGC